MSTSFIKHLFSVCRKRERVYEAREGVGEEASYDGVFMGESRERKRRENLCKRFWLKKVNGSLLGEVQLSKER